MQAGEKIYLGRLFMEKNVESFMPAQPPFGGRREQKKKKMLISVNKGQNVKPKKWYWFKMVMISRSVRKTVFDSSQHAIGWVYHYFWGMHHCEQIWYKIQD